MEAERYVVRELDGYNIGQGNSGGNSRLTLEVSVLDAREHYRIVQAFRSELVRTPAGHRAPRLEARRMVRAQAAALAAHLNEAP